MKILVTGATGFLGSRVVEYLTTKNNVEYILATGRQFNVHNVKISSPKVKYLLGDLSDPNFTNTLLEYDVEYVVNCASLSSPWGKKKAFYKANILTQQNLISASLRKSISRYIYISSPSVYFDFNNQEGIHEKTPLPDRFVNNYAETKFEAEKMIENSGLTYITLRPRALVGAGDTVIMPRLIKGAKEGHLKIMGNGDNIVDLTSVSNMCRAIWLSLIGKAHCCNTDYNITNGEPIKLWGAINYMLVKLDFPKIEKKIPYSILFSIATLMELKAKYISPNKEPVLTKYSVGILAKSIWFDISKAKNKLGYVPLQTTREAMDEFLNWYTKKIDK